MKVSNICAHLEPGLYKSCTLISPFPVTYQVIDAASARIWLDKFDDIVSRGGVPDRVSQKFGGDGIGNLRAEMEMMASTGSVAVALQSEITAYQCCMMDDSFTEGPHAVLSRLVHKARCATPAWWSGTARLAQNIVLKKTMDQINPGRFATLFNHWRGLFATSGLHRRTLKRRRAPKFFKAFFKRVYRYDEYASVSAESIAKHQSYLTSLTNMRPISFSSTLRVLKQYLSESMITGGVYSVPCQHNLSGLKFFQLLDLNPLRYKLVKTASSSSEFRQCCLPALMQPLVSTDEESSDRPVIDSVEVGSIGFPELKDLCGISDIDGGIHATMRSLKHWKVDDASSVGRMRLHTPLTVRDRVW